MPLTEQQRHQLLHIAETHGTPVYVYDTAIMRRQYDQFVQAFPADMGLKIKYAAKALTNLNVLRFFQGLGSGLDTVSLHELELGLKAGFAPEEIIFTPNGVSIDEISAAVEMGAVINIDNISILEQFGHRYGSTVPVSIRLNPHIYAGGHQKISTGHIDSKFGISIHQLRHVHRIVEGLNLSVRGIHMHTGSDIVNVDVFLQAADILLNAAATFKGLDFIDFGSGLKVAYHEQDVATDIAEVGERLSERMRQFNQEYGAQVAVWFEPGKFLVSESGMFLASVNVVKQTTATVFAGINSGFNHLLRPMFYEAYHHIENISNPNGTPRIYTVSGYICETDNFAWDRKISEIREGDILAFHNAGAYGYEMSSNYNSRPRPAEVWIHNGEVQLIRKRESLNDLLANVVDQSVLASAAS